MAEATRKRLDWTVPKETAAKIMQYVAQNGGDLSFTRFFWKQCEPIKYELDRYQNYANVLMLFSKGTSLNEITKQVPVNAESVRSWTRFEKRPKLAHHLSAFLELGKPMPGWKWLSISNSSGHAVPYGPFVQVPLTIKEWNEVRLVLQQLAPLDSVDSNQSLPYKLGFLLGVMIGDAAKKRQKNWHRHLELALSMKYDTNVRIGDFFEECAHSVGLRMHRMDDIAPYSGKPNGFYVWESQSSALVDWLFTVCLGMGEEELTTYNQVNMNWAMGGPEDFRRGLVQGMAESDGSVNISGQEVEFWIGPNWDFVRDLLRTFGVKSFQSRGALAISKTEVRKAFAVPVFAPQLQTVRYTRLQKLAGGKHIAHGRRIPLNVRNRITKLASVGKSLPQISERILDEFGLMLTFEAVQRWASRQPETKN